MDPAPKSSPDHPLEGRRDRQEVRAWFRGSQSEVWGLGSSPQKREREGGREREKKVCSSRNDGELRLSRLSGAVFPLSLLLDPHRHGERVGHSRVCRVWGNNHQQCVSFLTKVDPNFTHVTLLKTKCFTRKHTHNYSINKETFKELKGMHKITAY